MHRRRFALEDGKRRSDYAINTQVPIVGCLEYEVTKHGPYKHERVAARLFSEARCVTWPAWGVDRRDGVPQEGSQHSISDRQAWWCEAPPRKKALVDHGAVVAARLAQYERMKRAGDYS